MQDCEQGKSNSPAQKTIEDEMIRCLIEVANGTIKQPRFVSLAEIAAPQSKNKRIKRILNKTFTY